MQLVGAGYTLERIATDFLGPLPETENGNKFILVISDYFTKWVEVVAIPDQTASYYGSKRSWKKLYVGLVPQHTSIQIRIDSSREQSTKKCVDCWVSRKPEQRPTIPKATEW